MAASRSWWMSLLHELIAQSASLDDWELEFVAGLAQQRNVAPDQMLVLSDLVCRLRADQQQAA